MGQSHEPFRRADPGKGQMMMCPRVEQVSQDWTLFDFGPETREIDRLSDERRVLHARIVKLPPHSHHRVELQARLKLLTQEQLDVERRFSAKGGND